MSRGESPTTWCAARWIALGAGTAAATYGALVAAAYLWYGRPRAPTPEEEDPILDTFMPAYEVAERHWIQIDAPLDATWRAATNVRLQDSSIVSVIFRARELVLGAEASSADPRGLLEETLALGWRVLHEQPGREVVVGAVTRPWEPNVTFRGVPAAGFRSFDDPNYVKIVWTLRVEPVGETETICRTETRVTTTDEAARRRFRWYWARFSPGIVLIRWLLLRQLKADAERAARAATPSCA
jgi:hypothetical protein